MITDKELIFKIQQLKQIKPKQEWVIFAKRQILGFSGAVEEKIENKLTYQEIFSNIFGLLFQKKLAYALALVLLMVTGGVFIKYDYNIKVKNNLPAAVLESERAIKENLETFKARSKTLAQEVKIRPQNISMVANEVKEAAKSLTEMVQKNPETAKAIALEVNNNKTYLEVIESTDLKETSDILYKTIDNQMIEDLKKTTLTEEQQKAFDYIVNLYNQGKYSAALENILLFNASRNQ